MIAATTIESFSSNRDVRRHQKLLHQLCNNFVRKNGGDLEELEEIANIAYIEARNNYDPEKGTKFITYLHHIVNGRLKDWKRLRFHTKEETRDFQENPLADRVTAIDVIEQECSPDARLAMRWALEPPLGVAMIQGERPRNEPRELSLGVAIAKHLRELGWAMSRICQAFGEIQEVLSSC